jgi:hypothetical protein
MSTPRFKICDRVKLRSPIANKKISVGSIGTVTEDSDVPYVSWDGYSNPVAAAVHDKLELIEEKNQNQLNMSTFKFKVGDDVTVSENPVDKNLQPAFIQEMEPSKGKSAKIVKCFVGIGGNYYNITGDDVSPSYSYHEDWLSLKSEFKRGDLVWISDLSLIHI